MRPDAVLVGNNLAVLVAAAQLGASGRRVVLLDDGRRPGGHFRGMRVDDHDFDLGMVLLEQAPAGLERDVTGYRPEVRNDWVRFGALVWDWIESCVSTRRAPTPECLVEGRRGPDHLIANRLDVFSAAGAPAPIPLAPADDRHASNKLTAPVYDTLTYADAARLNHGEALHERFVEPFLRKLLGVSSDALLARYHRAAWVPLYWPETLAAACQGRAELLPEYPFWTTSSGFVGELVRRLESDVAALENVTVHSSPVARIALEGATCTVTAEDGARWSTPRPALGLAPDRKSVV